MTDVEVFEVEFAEDVMIDEATIARFEAKVDKSQGADACWPWTSATRKTGYGCFRFNGRTHASHRIAYLIRHGHIPSDKPFVCHSCDNRICVNPAHLWPGTNSDNMQDMMRKGRQRHLRGDRHPARLKPELLARGDRNGSRLHPEKLARGDMNPMRLYPEKVTRGAAHKCAKLTESQVLEIRSLAGHRNHCMLARRFGVSSVTIDNIVYRRKWAHLP